MASEHSITNWFESSNSSGSGGKLDNISLETVWLNKIRIFLKNSEFKRLTWQSTDQVVCQPNINSAPAWKKLRAQVTIRSIARSKQRPSTKKKKPIATALSCTPAIIERVTKQRNMRCCQSSYSYSWCTQFAGETVSSHDLITIHKNIQQTTSLQSPIRFCTWITFHFPTSHVCLVNNYVINCP